MIRRAIEKKAKGGKAEIRKVSYKTRGGGGRNDASYNYWHNAPTATVHEAIIRYARSVKQRQVRRRYEMAVFQQFYTGALQTIFASGGLFSAMSNQGGPAEIDRLSLNIIKSNIDAACAKVAKDRLQAFVLPNERNYRLKRKARNLTKFMLGASRLAKLPRHADNAFRDAGIFGTGAILCEPRAGKPWCVQAKQDEVIVDQVTGMWDAPYEIFYEHPYPRAELLARFPKKAAIINQQRDEWRGEMSFMSQADLVMTHSVWRLPFIDDKGVIAAPGRHCMVIGNGALVDEDWSREYLPIHRFHWTEPTYGPFGLGIAHELQGLQWAIMDASRNVAESIRMFAVPRIFIPTGSGLSKHIIDNEIGVFECEGTPIFSTPAAMSGDVYQWIQFLIDYSMSQIGNSKLEAQATKPEGLDSAVALRTMANLGAQRFAIVGQRWQEDFYVGVARNMIDDAAELYKDMGSVAMRVPGRGFIQKVKWADASMDPDEYDVGVWATQILPETPQGRRQAVVEEAQSGIMPPDVVIGQLDEPIYHDWVDQMTAARDDIENCLSSIVDDGKYAGPDDVSNVDLAMQMGLAAVQRAKADGTPPERLEMLRQFVDASISEKKRRAATITVGPGGPAPAGPGGAAGGPVGQAPPLPQAPLAAAGSGPVPAPAG